MAGDDANPPLPLGSVMFNELEIIGSHGIQAHEYGKVLDMILAGKLDPRLLTGKKIALEEAATELKAMGDFHNVGVTVIDRF
jgi:alcohol dehydrogenase